jgi:F-type H+-transporting ATPase subunit b
MNVAPPEPSDYPAQPAPAEPHGGETHGATPAADSTHSDPTQGTHESTGHDGKDHGGGGLPQLKPESFAGQLFWLAVTFTILYTLLASYALPRLAKVMADRKARIRADLDEAAKAQMNAESAGKAYEASLADARTRARKMSDEARASVQAQIDAKSKAEGERLSADVARAEQRIQAMRTQALSNVRGIAVDAAGSLVEKLSGGAADGTAVANAVDAVMKRG